MSLIRDYSLLVKKAYEEQNTLLFTQLFHFTDNDPSVLAICAELNSMPDKAITDSVDSLLEDTSYALAVAVNNYLRLIRSLSTGDPREVFEAFALFYTSFIPLFNVSETCYQVPVIKNLSSLLVQLALRADQTGLKGKAQKAHTAARLLSKTFNIMLADRSPIEVSKRQGLFHITNLAFKMYFRLNTIKLCQTFISNIGKGNVELEMFPMSQQVTYQYYLGRYYLLDGDFPKVRQ
ncbi:hypothetical protein BDB01DRAFT_753805 [Pilobolus umbonatus]|nr:hypothetical protein BDB01DRAFT_753805 [Pilobolus umbonatus]